MTKWEGRNKIIYSFLIFCCLTSFVSILIFSGGCSKNLVENGYDTIKTSNVTVDQLMTKAGELYKQGKISEKQKQKITKVYKKYRSAADMADEALAVYAETKNSETRNRYLEALENLNDQKSKFIELFRSLV